MAPFNLLMNSLLEQPTQTVCFTGHRPGEKIPYDETTSIVKKIKASLREQILKAISEGFFIFISGGALGIDLWAAEEVLEIKKEHPEIKLIFAKPFPSQDKIWPPKSKERFKLICQRADLVVDVSKDPYAAWKMQVRNVWMCDHSSLVIAVWDGTQGGTGNCVQYAEGKKKVIRRINPQLVMG